MGEDANIELARRLLAAFETGDEAVVDEIVHPAHRDHAAGERRGGPEAVRAAIGWAQVAFSGLRIVPEDIIASGDRVVARVRVSATQTGEVYGITATGRRMEVEQIHIWRVACGQLAEHWMVRDDLGAIRQLAPAAS